MMTPAQVEELKADEGLVLRVYDDATGRSIGPGSMLVGHPTIGYGRALDVQGISKDEAEAMLAANILEIQTSLNKLPWFTELDPVRQGVFVNLAYNMGVLGVQTFTKTIALVKADKFDAAADELANSRWATQVQKSRVTRLLQQLRTGALVA